MPPGLGRGTLSGAYAAHFAKSGGADGRTYNNARLMRWFLRRTGDEEAFRELVYRQWRENLVDGWPRSTTAAFQAKLSAAVSATKGGAA